MNIYLSNKVLRCSSSIIQGKSVFTCCKLKFALYALALVAAVVRRIFKAQVIWEIFCSYFLR